MASATGTTINWQPVIERQSRPVPQYGTRCLARVFMFHNMMLCEGANFLVGILYHFLFIMDLTWNH